MYKLQFKSFDEMIASWTRDKNQIFFSAISNRRFKIHNVNATFFTFVYVDETQLQNALTIEVVTAANAGSYFVEVCEARDIYDELYNSFNNQLKQF